VKKRVDRLQRPGSGIAPIRERQLTGDTSSFDTAYIRWRTKFAPFEAGCFEALCEFVRVHFDKLLDRYYLEGHDSLNEFPAWAFERYLRR
jgi:hypothetical protein